MAKQVKDALTLLCEAVDLQEKGLKTYFSLQDRVFYFRNSKGMIRMKSVARSVVEVAEKEPLKVLAGEYDYLLEDLYERTFYVPQEGEPIMLSADYESFLATIEAEDPLDAINIHADLPMIMAVACLGKTLLAKMAPKLADTSTLENLADGSVQNTTGSAQGPEGSENTTSEEPAQGFTVGVNSKG